MLSGAWSNISPGTAATVFNDFNSRGSQIYVDMDAVELRLEDSTQQIQTPGAITGLVFSDGGGLTTSYTAGDAMLGVYIEVGAATAVLYDNSTNYIYLRQDGTLHIDTDGTPAASPAGTPTVLLATITTVAGVITVINNSPTAKIYARKFTVGKSTPPSPNRVGDLWVDTSGATPVFKICTVAGSPGTFALSAAAISSTPATDVQTVGSAGTGPEASAFDHVHTLANLVVATGKIANDAVTYAKIQNVTATDKVLGRATAGAGDVEEIACTAAGRAILDDADAAAQRTTLGLGDIDGVSIGSSGYLQPIHSGDNQNFTMSVAGRVYCIPIRALVTMTLSGVQIAVGTAAGNLRVGLYSDSSGPATLLAESASTAAAANVMEVAFAAAVQLTAGVIYWLVVQSDTTTCTARGPVAQIVTGGSYPWYYFPNSGGYGAFETPRISGLVASTGPTLRGVITSIP